MVSRIAGIVLWPFSPGASYAKGGFKSALYSMALALFFLFDAEWQFAGGANQFTEYVRPLLQGGRHPNLFARDIGYPLLLLVLILGGAGLIAALRAVFRLPWLSRFSAWAEEVSPVEDSNGPGWKPWIGLAVCSIALFAIWAWQTASGS